MNPQNIHFVLIGTTHPGNIGSAARALKTMALNQLHLVQPESFPHPQARANAAHALDVLEASQVHADLDAALAGAGLVAGITGRARRLGAPTIDLRSFAQLAAEESRAHPVALLFGREHSGLSNEELDRCQYAVYIPASKDSGVLNLAAAVQVVAYELFMAAQAPRGEAVREPASFEHLESLYQHLEQVLAEVGYLYKRNPELLMRRLRAVFGRSRPDRREINALRGALRAIEQRLR